MIDSSKGHARGVIPSSINRTQARDTGMAMVLICLLGWVFTHANAWVVAALVLLVINMTVPMVFKPLGFVWFGLSNVLGAVVSRLILSLIFFIVVTPLALVRRAMGHDSLKLKQWKQGKASVFVERNHRYQADDLEQLF